ncbi:MAG: hypothetical protein HY722_09750 [Planctomycetes bacterium]|nr:hypothetical protein [Planctomycetota bacterium]
MKSLAMLGTSRAPRTLAAAAALAVMSLGPAPSVAQDASGWEAEGVPEGDAETAPAPRKDYETPVEWGRFAWSPVVGTYVFSAEHQIKDVMMGGLRLSYQHQPWLELVADAAGSQGEMKDPPGTPPGAQIPEQRGDIITGFAGMSLRTTLRYFEEGNTWEEEPERLFSMRPKLILGVGYVSLGGFGKDSIGQKRSEGKPSAVLGAGAEFDFNKSCFLDLTARAHLVVGSKFNATTGTLADPPVRTLRVGELTAGLGIRF